MKEIQIAKLVDVLKDIDVKELRIEAGDFLIFVKESGDINIFKLIPSDNICIKKRAEEQEEIVTISAPSAGVFYRRPEPNAPAYVEIGSMVEPGDTLALIEVMKSFGPVISEIRGEIADILVEDGKTVEYGQALFLIKKR